MNTNIVLFITSVLPVIVIARYVYKKDRNKEPLEILAKLFIGGVASCFLVIIISLILGKIFPIFSADSTTLNAFELFIYVFIGVALVEEACKWVMSYFISYKDYDFDEFFDMIVYSVVVALGFACFENLLYVFETGIFTGLLRALTAVPTHACCGMLMGYHLGISKIGLINGRKDIHKKNMILSIAVPVLLHGLYDYCLFLGRVETIVGILIFMVFVYVYVIRKINKASKATVKIIDKFCLQCGHIIDGNFCPMCGKKHD
jgi:Predicted membrane protein